MKETTLLKCALIFSLVGLVALHFTAQSIEIKDYRPMLDKDIGEDVRLTGTIKKVRQPGNVVFISLLQENPLTIVFFSDEKFDFGEKDRIEIFGKVQSYNGKKEIIAEKVSAAK